MNLEFRKATREESKLMANWKFEGEYSFYGNDKTQAKKELIENMFEDEFAFVIYNENNELIGNCCFDRDEDDNGKEVLLFGIQMKPELTGKGLGKEVVEKALEFGKSKFKYNEINLLVAKFNKRAIKVYEKIGFKKIDEFIMNANGEQKEFIEMNKKWK